MNDDFEAQEATITLSYVHSDGNQYQFTFEEPLTWPEALDKMVKFIGVIYGYDITDQVAIKSKSQRFNEDKWSGSFFGNEYEGTNPGLSD